jgi:hypothetical protein
VEGGGPPQPLAHADAAARLRRLLAPPAPAPPAPAPALCA